MTSHTTPQQKFTKDSIKSTLISYISVDQTLTCIVPRHSTSKLPVSISNFAVVLLMWMRKAESKRELNASDALLCCGQNLCRISRGKRPTLLCNRYNNDNEINALSDHAVLTDLSCTHTFTV